MCARYTLRVIAIIEGLKGLAVVAAGVGALSLVHANAQATAELIVGRLHLDAANGFPRIFVEYSANLNDARIGILAAMAMVYAIGRFIEAYGLWYDQKWAEWFAVTTAAVYVPFELLAIVRGDGWIAIAALLVNGVVIAVMLNAMRRRRAAGPASQDSKRAHRID